MKEKIIDLFSPQSKTDKGLPFPHSKRKCNSLPVEAVFTGISQKSAMSV